MSPTVRGLVFATTAVALAISCAERNATNIWSDVLQDCAAGSQFKDVLYFSLSNNIGPGSVWRQTSEGRYILVAQFDSTLPKANRVIKRGGTSACAGKGVSSSSYGGEVGVEKFLSIMPIGVSPEFKRARSVDVSVGSWAWDQVEELPFQEMLSAIRQQDSTNGYYKSLTTVRKLIGRAVRADSITALLNFDDTTAASLHASYPAGLTVTGKASAKWQTSKALKVLVSQPVYIAVEMYKWAPEGFSAGHQLATIPRKEGDTLIAESASGASR